MLLLLKSSLEDQPVTAAKATRQTRLPYLASQWIPSDPTLWEIKNFRNFLEARKKLLADEVNKRLEDLLHGDLRWLDGAATPMFVSSTIIGGITSEAEEEQLEILNVWMEQQGLPRGLAAYDFADAETGEQRAIFDLAWPNGVQEGLSQPAAILLNEGADVVSVASQVGFRCFQTVEDFKRYVEEEILRL